MTDIEALVLDLLGAQDSLSRALERKQVLIALALRDVRDEKKQALIDYVESVEKQADLWKRRSGLTFDQADKLEALVARMRKMLEKLDDPTALCPVCGADPNWPHETDCQLTALFDETRDLEVDDESDNR